MSRHFDLLGRRPKLVAALSTLHSAEERLKRSLHHTPLDSESARVLRDLRLVVLEETLMGGQNRYRRHKRFIYRTPRGDALVGHLTEALRQKNFAPLPGPAHYSRSLDGRWQAWKAWDDDLRDRRDAYKAALAAALDKLEADDAAPPPDCREGTD